MPPGHSPPATLGRTLCWARSLRPLASLGPEGTLAFGIISCRKRPTSLFLYNTSSPPPTDSSVGSLIRYRYDPTVETTFGVSY
jgi:hypothetical protein